MKLFKYILLLSTILLLPFLISAQENTIGEAEYLIKVGNFEEAIVLLNDYIELNQSDAKAYICRAIAHGSLGELKEKDRDLKYAKYLNPFAYMYISNTARSMVYEKKMYEYSFDNLSKEFSKSPVKNNYYELYLRDIINRHSQDSLISKAIYYLSINDLPNTELLLAEIEPSEKIMGIIYDLKGLVSLKKNNLPEAIEYFTSCIEKMPAFPLAYHNRAIAYKLSGDFEAAGNDLEFALSLNEDISVFYFTYAKLNELVEDNNEAKENYKLALERNPDYLEARTNYSILQKTLGSYNTSMLELDEIVESSDKKMKSTFIKGGIYLTYGEYENAIKEFDNYLSKNRDDSNALFNRGLAKLLQGKKSEGCQDIESSIDIKSTTNRNEIFMAFCPNF